MTAEKRAERLQDVPASVSALSGDTLQAMGAQSFTDYARSIPGLTFTDSGGGRQTPAIRGINPSAGAGTVSFYIDETPIPGAQGSGEMAEPALVDIDRIEVLRGPHGTLYGSSSIGGTIKLIPNAPNLTRFEGSVKAEAIVTEGESGASPGAEGGAGPERARRSGRCGGAHGLLVQGHRRVHRPHLHQRRHPGDRDRPGGRDGEEHRR